MNREELINTILDLSLDEVSIHTMEIIAKESYEDLVKRLGIIAIYYHKRAKSN